jgi:acetylornithine/N-succinyldiaminopimelate aminotransferase
MTELLVPEAVSEGAPAAAPYDVSARELDLLAPVYPLPRLELVSGRGTWVEDAKGARYLDFVCGIAVHALGHAPAGLAPALAKQAKRLVHCSNLFANAPAAKLAAALTEATGYDRVFFCNSGTEGVEAALKFARALAAQRGRDGRGVLAFEGGFHGRTAFSLSATHTPAYRAPFEPLMPGVRFARFNDVAALEAALDESIGAVIVEPVQGEGGAIPADPKFLEALVARARALGVAVILDEVQSGMGRCGSLLASAHYGVRGDFVVMSKALGGGVPLGAVLMTAEAASALAPGMDGCTFGGNPLATTAGLHVLAKVNSPALLARVRSRGKRLAAALRKVVAAHPSLEAERGLGLLRAVVLAADAPFTPAALVQAAREQGLLLVRGGDRAIRFLPPLTVSAADIDEAVARFARAVDALEAASPAKGQES